jgi:hypothetical protein
MTRLKQINVDGSALQGIDLSQVSNQKIAMPKASRTRLSGLDKTITQASISAAASASNLGKWAVIPQDFGGGSLSATMIVPTPTPAPAPTPTPTPGPLTIRPDSVAVSIGVTALVVVGVNMAGGAYWESITSDFGLLGSLGFAGSTSLGVSGAIDVLMWHGSVTALDGPGACIIVDVGVSKTLFLGFGILVALPSWTVIGYIMEFGGGSSIGPPITINAQLSYGGHIKLGRI